MDLSALLKFDTALLIDVNHARSPFLDVVMPVISDFSMLVPVLVPFLAWRLYKGDSRERILWICAVAAVAMSDLLCSRVIKEIVGRPRPYEVLDGIYLFKSSRWLITDPSFRAGISGTLAWPSCHAMNMWTAASYLTTWWGRRAIMVIIFAFLVCWSRLYLGVHYPLDVAGGILIGILEGFLIFRGVEFLISRYGAE